MKDLNSMISDLDRPRLLVQAARHAAPHYDRTRQLPRLLGTYTLPRTAQAAMTLLTLEADWDDKRKTAAADYVAARHIDVLTALIVEARLLRATPPSLVARQAAT